MNDTLQRGLKALSMLAILAVLFSVILMVSAQATDLVLPSTCPLWVISQPAGGAQAVTCNSEAPPAVPVCTLSGPSSGVVGQQITLSASCSNSPNAYTWAGASCPSSPACQITSPAAGTNTYSVTASNGGGTSVPVSKQVVWSDNSVISCAGFTKTKVIDITIPANGAANNRYFTSSLVGGFSQTDALVFRFRAPMNEQLFRVTMIEEGNNATSQPSYRTMTLSAQACDFTFPKGPNAVLSVQDTGFNVSFTTIPGSQYSKNVLDGGRLYYLNVSNYMNGQAMCAAGRCDVFATTQNQYP